MTKKSTFLILFTSVMMVGIPALYYTRPAAKSVRLTQASEADLRYDESGKPRTEAEIAKVLKRKNKDLYLKMFKESEGGKLKGKAYTYHTVKTKAGPHAFYAYILEKDEQFSLHLFTRCTTPKGLSLDHFNLSFDEDVTEYYPTNSFVREETPQGITEKGDITVTYPEEIILSGIVDARLAKVKFVGAREEVELELSEEDKHAIERTLIIYKALK